MPRSRAGLIAGAAAGAALAALALPRSSFWPLGWLGLAPLFYALNAAESRRRAALAGFVAGWAYHAAVLHWIYATCRFALIPPAAAVLAWAALAAVLAVQWAVVGWLGSWLGARCPRVLRPWLWAVLWTGLGAAASWWTPRIGVDVLTYTQGPNLALLQAGSWGGPFLVGFLVALVNAAVAESWVDAQAGAHDGPSRPALAAAALLTAAIWGHGEWVLLRRPPAPAGPTARVEILQPVIDQYAKWDSRYIQEILGRFDQLLSLPRPRNPALVVWPETSIPRWTSRGVAAPEAARWAAKLGAEHLVGVVARAQDSAGPANGVQLVRPDGSVGGFYAKRELVPFGEYVPFRWAVPRFVIDRWLAVLDNLGDMEAGPKAPALIETPFGKTSVTICYEAMFPRWARRDAARGSRLLVNVTNDGWYKDTWGPYQHFAVNALRAIENREWVIRSGNTGVSAVIDPWGVVVAELPLNVRGRLDADVPLEDAFPARSFYARHGDWLGALCLFLTALACVGRLTVLAG